jgi:polyprenyl P-hydroxybenzoate/phenylacrylic acid decarboxylase-like protein
MASSRSQSTTPRERVVVALSGGDGIAYGVRLLETLRGTAETHLVLGRAAAAALGADVDAVRALADQVYAEGNQAARISSGSFLTRGMIVAPCDAGSLAVIVMGLATNLVYRAADVTLKERRPLVVGVPAARLARVDRDILARAAAVPGLSVLPVEEPAGACVAALLARLGIGDGVPGRP